MFTPKERDRVRERLLQLAEADPRVDAAAITGSYVAEESDDWSDIDLAFGIRGDLPPVLEAWTELVYREFTALHHWTCLLPRAFTVFSSCRTGSRWTSRLLLWLTSARADRGGVRSSVSRGS